MPLTPAGFASELRVHELHPWQQQCLHAYLTAEDMGTPGSPRGRCRNLVYAAPTSGGKTLVAVLLMLRRISELVPYSGGGEGFGRALYVLPLRATVSELSLIQI